MDRNNFERLRTEIQMLLTEYEEGRNNVDPKDEKVLADLGWYLYKDIVALVNESEDWEVEE